MKHYAIIPAMVLSLVTIFPAAAHVPVIGHRGGMWGVENTAGCFRAGAQWFDGMETDTKLTSDGVLVCWHDADFSNFGYDAEASKIRTHTLKELQAMPLTQKTAVGTFTDTICTFGTYLDICRENHVIAYIEIKWVDNYFASNSAAGMPQLMQLVKDHGMLDHCILMSSIETCLNWIRERPEYDSIPCQYLGMTGSGNPTMAQITAWAETHEGDIDPECYQLTGKSQVTACHEKGIKVACWNVTNTASYNKYKDMGVDFITADTLRPMYLDDYTPRTGFLDVKHIPAPPASNPYGWTKPEDMYDALAADILEGKNSKHERYSFSDYFTQNKKFSAPSSDLNASGIAVDIKTFDNNFFSHFADKWAWIRKYIDARCAADGVSDTQLSGDARSKAIRYNLAAFFANTKGTDPVTADFTHCGASSTAFIPYWKYTFCTPSGTEKITAAPSPSCSRRYENGQLVIQVGDKTYSATGAALR